MEKGRVINMLKNKTILITGAASGLGKAWSKKFSDEGAKVFACDINEEGLNELKDYEIHTQVIDCLLYTSPSPRDYAASRMPSSA